MSGVRKGRVNTARILVPETSVFSKLTLKVKSANDRPTEVRSMNCRNSEVKELTFYSYGGEWVDNTTIPIYSITRSHDFITEPV